MSTKINECLRVDMHDSMSFNAFLTEPAALPVAQSYDNLSYGGGTVCWC